MERTSAVIHSILLFSTLVSLSLVSCDPPSTALQDKCSPDFTKVGDCMNYASAKADTPTPTCCTSVGEIRQKDPVCLCFIIQQVHAGGSSVTSLGLQVGRLIQLPAACKLPNMNITDCPRLLGLSPTSPDSAIFTNATTAATTSPSTSNTPPAGALSGSMGSSHGVMHQIYFAGTFATAVISAVFLSFF